MKKMIVAALLIAGMASFAQDKKPMDKKAQAEQMTPEQRNELHLKKLTLDLGLNASQQKEMAKVISEQSAKMEKQHAEMKARKESDKKLTADERFAMESKRLDEQIAVKERVKKILTAEQFEKWEKMMEHKRGEMKEHMHEKKRHHQDNSK
jgi:hypothetical protein